MKLTDGQLKQHRIALALGSVPSRAPQFAPLITEIIDRLKLTELLDYGCGNGDLVAHLKPGHALTIQRYDPALDEYAGEPVPMQMVVAVDVLNVLDLGDVDAVLYELEKMTGSVLFAAIGPGHLGPVQWVDILEKHFDVHTFQRLGENDCFVIAYAKKPDSPIIVEH